MFDMVTLAVSATDIVSNIQAFIGPLLLLGIGVIAIKHLMTRQMTQFFQFMALAILVLLLFYTPGVLIAIVNVVGDFFGLSAQGQNVSVTSVTTPDIAIK